MKFVIAPDSFKGGLTAKEAAKVIARGLKRVFPEADYILVPMADGGEGTVQSLVDATKGQLITETVTGPLGQPVVARFGLLGNGTTGVVEMAQALGVRLLDRHNRAIGFGGGALSQLTRIDTSHMDPRLRQLKISIASDVTNPLVGKNGASNVFGPQKGATAEMVKTLDENLIHYAALIKQALGKDLANYPGAGAAGGLGAGLLAFTNAKMTKGIDLVIQYSGLKQKARHADFVFTGEGGIDFQTKFGKTPYGVALATKAVSPGAPVIAIAGNIGRGVDSLYSENAIDAIFSSVAGAKTLSQALQSAPSDIAQTAENIGRLIAATRN